MLVSLDDIANDGGFLLNGVNGRPALLPELDNVHSDVENVRTGVGDDVLIGSAAANTLDGGAGDDSLDGGAGLDFLQGGPGINQVSYAKRTAGVTVKLDDLANDGDTTDGPAGARDDVRSIRNVIGGSGPDTLVGNGATNSLLGGPGDDTLTGLGGGDTLRGDTGSDRIDANDGVKDTVNCGPDRDRETALDLADAPEINGTRVIPASCESVSIAPVGELPTMRITQRSLRPRHGSVHVRLSCPDTLKASRCEGRLDLAAPQRPREALASAPYHLPRGRDSSVDLRLRHTRTRTLVATATGRGPTGRPHLTMTRLDLR